MSFASILQTIQTRIMAPATAEYYTLNSITPPSNVIPWENNPTQWDESDYPQPPRPYLGVEWSDIPLTLDAGRQSGKTDFTVKVVVDNFHQGRNDSEDKNDYYNLLLYADKIEELLHQYQGIEILGLQRPVFAGKKNIVIIGIRCRIEVKKQRARLPWEPTPVPPPED